MALAVRSASQNSSTTGTALSVSAPSGATTGDFVVCIVHANGQTTIADNNGSTPFTEAPNFSDYQPNTDNGHTISVFYRTIADGDPSTYNFTSGASGRWAVVAISYSGSGITFDVAPNTSNAANADGSDSGTINVPSISVAAATYHTVFCGWDTSSIGSITTPAGYTLAANANGGGEPTHVSYKYNSSSASTGLVSCVNSEYGARIAGSFSVKEAAGSSSVSPSVSPSLSPSSSQSPSRSPSSSQSPSLSPSSSNSPSVSPSSSKSPSLSPSSSQSPSVSPSAGGGSTPSPSLSPSSSISPSESPSKSPSNSPSYSPSSSISPSTSPSSSQSPSLSPSASKSPSPSPSNSPSQSPSTSPSVSPSVAPLLVKKEILYKIYESDGTFITTWADVVSEFSYKWIINGSLSNITLRLARPESSFGENDDVKQGNLLEVYIFDEESGVDGVLVYSGILVSYIPAVQGGKEYVDVEFFPHYWNLKNTILEDSGDTEVPYLSQDPGAIMRDVLDKYAGTTTHITGSVDDTSTTVSYTYNTNDCQYAVQKVLELCPDGWFFRVGADNIVYMEAREANPTHYFTMGREIVEYYPEKRSEGIINTVYFRGGSTLYKKYTNSSSAASYGTRAVTVIDERVTVEATADIIADRILDAKSSPEIRVVIKIMDSNGDGNEKGYDIESIKPGQTCKILNATSKSENLWDVVLWDGASWDYDITNAAATQLQIMSVEYHLDYAVVELSNRQPDIAKRIEDINRNQVDAITVDNPTAPTT